MSLFPQLESTAYIFLANDSGVTKITSFDTADVGDADFTEPMNIIRMGHEERIIFEDIRGEFKANVPNSWGASLTKGTVIKQGNGWFTICNRPKQLKFFNNRYKLILRDAAS